jgi:hypothetical protein
MQPRVKTVDLGCQIVYGIQVLPIGDPYIEIAEKGMEAVTAVGVAGTFLVDTLPIRKSLFIVNFSRVYISHSSSETCSRMDSRSELSTESTHLARSNHSNAYSAICICEESACESICSSAC